MRINPVNLLFRSTEPTTWSRRRTPNCGTSSTRPLQTGRTRQVKMNLEKIKSEIEAAVSGCRLQIVVNRSPSGQHSLWIEKEYAFEVAQFLRDDPELRLDYCSNVTGVDWLDSETSEKVKVKRLVD